MIAMARLSRFDPTETRKLVELTCRLVREPSVLGDEAGAARVLLAALEEWNFDSCAIDEAGNVWGLREGSAPGPTLLLDGHLDTVGVDPVEAWNYPPFGASLEDQRVYGRGTSDMKGALAAMVVGIGGLPRTALRGRVIVCGSLGEETTEGTALRPVLDRFRPDAVIVGEATDLAVATAGRGRAEYLLTVHGRPAHASTPAQGINAIELMSRVVLELQNLALPVHPVAGPAAWCVTDVISSPYPAQSVVPCRCRATLERRLLPGETRPGVEAEVQEMLAFAGIGEYTLELGRADYTTWTGRQLSAAKWYPPWMLDPSDGLLRAAQRGLESAGLPFRTTAYRFCTNAAETAGVRGIPTLGLGPSREQLAHVVDEYVEVEDLCQAALAYRMVAVEVLGMDPEMIPRA